MYASGPLYKTKIFWPLVSAVVDSYMVVVVSNEVVPSGACVVVISV